VISPARSHAIAQIGAFQPRGSAFSRFVHIVKHAHDAEHGRRMNSLAQSLVVKADVAPDRPSSLFASLVMPSTVCETAT